MKNLHLIPFLLLLACQPRDLDDPSTGSDSDASSSSSSSTTSPEGVTVGWTTTTTTTTSDGSSSGSTSSDSSTSSDTSSTGVDSGECMSYEGCSDIQTKLMSCITNWDGEQTFYECFNDVYEGTDADSCERQLNDAWFLSHDCWDLVVFDPDIKKKCWDMVTETTTVVCNEMSECMAIPSGEGTLCHDSW